MTNKIVILNSLQPPTTLGELKPGELFRYRNRHFDDNVYMRVTRDLLVWLRTGEIFNVSPASVELIVERLPPGTKIEITTG